MRIIKWYYYATPFSLALYAVVTLYQANTERLEPSQMIMPAIFGLGIAGLFLLLFWLFKWTTNDPALVATGFTGAFLLWHLISWQITIIILVVLLGIVIIKRFNTTHWSMFLTLLFVTALFISSGLIIIDRVGANPEAITLPYTYEAGKSNIYFIVPDHMPSPQAMRESGINPDKSVENLRMLGFYVKDNQLSNDQFTLDYTGKLYTTRTMRFFASVLNNGVDIPLDIQYKDCRNMIKDNQIFKDLHNQGYRIINIASWFTETANFVNADANLKFTEVSLFERFMQNELGEAFFDRTILRGLPIRAMQSDNSINNIEIRRLNWQKANIVQIANSGGDQSTFVIAHVILPHEPYIFGDPDDSIPDQFYANVKAALVWIDEVAKGIVAVDPSAVVIVQSDEGMAYRKPEELNYDLSFVQWNGVFSVWYMPDYVRDKEKITHTQILDVVVNSK